MSALGQKRTLRNVRSMSALPPKADIVQHGGNVRFVPKADSCTAAIWDLVRSNWHRSRHAEPMLKLVSHSRIALNALGSTASVRKSDGRIFGAVLQEGSDSKAAGFRGRQRLCLRPVPLQVEPAEQVVPIISLPGRSVRHKEHIPPCGRN
jgi:hypothetical protein